MDSHSEDVDWAARRVEAGIFDVLVVASQPIHFVKVGTEK
jgi:hypothetical protein